MMRMAGLLALMMGLTGLAAAEGTRTLDINEAVALAAAQNLALARASADLNAKARVDGNAWNVLVPSVSLGAGLSRANEARNPFGALVEPNWNYNNSLGLSLSITPSLLTDLQRVRLNLSAGKLSYETARKSLEKNVRLVFYSLLVESESIRLSKDNQARKEKNLADARAKYKAGLIPELDVLSAQVAYESLKPSLAQQETAHLNNLGQFQALLGLPLDDTLVLKGSLPELSRLNLPAGGSSPDVQAAELNVEASRLAAESSRLSSWLPSLSLSWRTAPGLVLTDGAKWMDNAGSLSLNLSYTLDSFLPWTQSQERLVQADEAVAANRSKLEEARVNADLKRRTALRKIEQVQTSLKSQDLNIQLALKTLNLTQEAYNRGTKDLDALQTADANLNQARYEQLSQSYTLLSAVLDLEYELNVPFGTMGVKE